MAVTVAVSAGCPNGHCGALRVVVLVKAFEVTLAVVPTVARTRRALSPAPERLAGAELS